MAQTQETKWCDTEECKAAVRRAGRCCVTCVTNLRECPMKHRYAKSPFVQVCPSWKE